MLRMEAARRAEEEGMSIADALLSGGQTGTQITPMTPQQAADPQFEMQSLINQARQSPTAADGA